MDVISSRHFKSNTIIVLYDGYDTRILDVSRSKKVKGVHTIAFIDNSNYDFSWLDDSMDEYSLPIQKYLIEQVNHGLSTHSRDDDYMELSMDNLTTHNLINR